MLTSQKIRKMWKATKRAASIILPFVLLASVLFIPTAFAEEGGGVVGTNFVTDEKGFVNLSWGFTAVEGESLAVVADGGIAAFVGVAGAKQADVQLNVEALAAGPKVYYAGVVGLGVDEMAGHAAAMVGDVGESYTIDLGEGVVYTLQKIVVQLPEAAPSDSGDGVETEGEEGTAPTLPVARRALAPTEILFKPVSLVSNNATSNTGLASDGDEITVQFEVNDPTIVITPTPTSTDAALVWQEPLAGTVISDGDFTYLVEVIYKVSAPTGGAVKFSFDLSLAGVDEVYTVTAADFDEVIRYYTPLPSDLDANPFAISDVTFEKDLAASPSGDDAGYAKEDDTVQVSFMVPIGTPRLSLSTTDSSIGGAVASLSEPASTSVPGFDVYTASAVLAGTGAPADGSALDFSLVVTDGTHTTTLRPVNSTTQVIYCAEITQMEASFTGQSNGVDVQFVGDGDTLVLTYDAVGHRAPVSAKTLDLFADGAVGPQGVSFAPPLGAGSNGETISYEIVGTEGFALGDELGVWLVVYDLAGNKFELDLSLSTGIYYLPTLAPTDVPSIPSLTHDYNVVMKNETVQGVAAAKAGDTITVSLTDCVVASDRMLVLQVGDQDYPMTATYDSVNGVSNYSVTFTLGGSGLSDNEAIGFIVWERIPSTGMDYYYLQYDPAAYVAGTGPQVEPTPVLVFYEDLALVDVRMMSLERGTGNNDFAKNGSSLVLEIETNHPVNLSDVSATIAEETSVVANISTANPNVVQVNYTITGSEVALQGKDNLPIGFEFTVTDVLGQDIGPVSYDSLGTGDAVGIAQNDATVYYYAPLNFLPGITSDNQNSQHVSSPKLAKNGDTLTVTVSSPHAIAIDKVELSAPAANASNPPVVLTPTAVGMPSALAVPGGNVPYEYTFEYVLTDGFALGIADVGAISVKVVEAHDRLTEPSSYTYPTDYTGLGTFTPVTYYAPIVISNVVQTTNNSEDGTKYAKNGDSVTVSFTTNHDLDTDISSGSVLGQGGQAITGTANGDGTYTYSFTYAAIQGTEISDLQDLWFSFAIEDPAGNVKSRSSDEAYANIIKYYAPIKATVSMRSNNRRAEWAKNGDTISVSTKVNHEASIVKSVIATRTGTAHGNLTTTPSATYTIPGGEAGIPEGLLTFSITLKDPAGNTEDYSATNDSPKTQVTYDRTLPAVTLIPVYSGFANKDVSFAVVFADEHMDPNAFSFLLNSVEQIDGTDRAIAGGVKVFTKNITLTRDNEYTLKGTITDMAGNTCALDATANVILDKTSPVIKVNLDKNTFISGTSPSDIFEIVEKYIKDIVCTITDTDGVNEWDMDSPLVTEGKKTVFLTAVDMAGNTATPLSYDIYIDGTAPKPTVVEAASGAELLPGKATAFAGKSVTLSVSLAAIHMGDEEPDTFTTVQLLDAQGNVVQNAMPASGAANGPYTFEIKEHGSYTLVVEAVDGVGNKLEKTEYKIEFGTGLGEPVTPTLDPSEIVHDNPVIVVMVVAAGLLLLFGLVWFFLVYKRRKKATDQ